MTTLHHAERSQPETQPAAPPLSPPPTPATAAATADDRPCAVCGRLYPVAVTWPWTARRRICVPCLRDHDQQELETDQ